MKRAFVVVLDACGIGALDDADQYGDQGTNTLANLARVTGGLQLPNLQRLGLGSIVDLDGIPPASAPVIHGRLHAIGPGKDSTAGHWALMGVANTTPPPTYPDGFPEEIVTLIGRLSSREVICNRPYNGIDAISDFGAEHLRTGALIVYTSQDSVLQIAAHETVMPASELQQICAEVRRTLPSEHAVGRVIARPFTGPEGDFQRTDQRHDFALEPPTRSYLDALAERGIPVHSVGKAGALFAGRGVSDQHPGASNASAISSTTELLKRCDHGLVFTNLIETDQVYGHRHDAAGFAEALTKIDQAVGEWLTLIGEQDLLILTADHGVDVTANHTDHTREYVPLLAMTGSQLQQPGWRGARHDGPMADVGASVLDWLSGSDAPDLPGSTFL